MATQAATRPYIAVPSKSLPGEHRRVSLDLTSCNCPGFLFNRGTCRHITEARAQVAKAARKELYALRLCRVCRVNPVWDGFTRCVSCAEQAVEVAPLPLRPVRVAANRCQGCGKALASDCTVAYHMACVPAGVNLLNGYAPHELVPARFRR